MACPECVRSVCSPLSPMEGPAKSIGSFLPTQWTPGHDQCNFLSCWHIRSLRQISSLPCFPSPPSTPLLLHGKISGAGANLMRCVGRREEQSLQQNCSCSIMLLLVDITFRIPATFWPHSVTLNSLWVQTF